MGGKVALLAASLMLVTAGALAQPGPGQHMMNRQGTMHQSMLNKLNLTDSQKDQISKLRYQFQKQQIQTRAKIADARLDLRQLLRSDSPDRSAVEKAVGAIADIQRQQKLNLVDHLFAVRAILTPEQQKTFKEFMGPGAFGRESMGMRGWMRGGMHNPQGGRMGTLQNPMPEEGGSEM